MATAAELKDEGNAHFKAGEYAKAVELYTQSLELDGTQHLAVSNRSAAYLKLGGSEELALEDGKRCVELAPAFAKGYSRQAAALQALKRWDEAVAICEKGMTVAADDTLKKMLSECRAKKFADKVTGPWHGKVAEQLGGYEQEMEFLAGGKVEVTVFGRSVTGTYWLNCDKDPHDLTIQVPMPDMAPGMPPPPPVNYIVRLDDVGLHICCPTSAFGERPTDFTGSGYCQMQRGKLAVECASGSLEGVSEDEKMLLCAREFAEALPSQKLEDLQPTDTEESSREKLMAQVKFESSMFALKQRFGDDLLMAVHDAASKGDSVGVPKGLQDTPELRTLRERLLRCELLPPGSGDAPQPPAEQRPAPPTPAAAPATMAGEASSPGKRGSTGAAVCMALSVSAVAVVLGAVFLQRRRR